MRRLLRAAAATCLVTSATLFWAPPGNASCGAAFCTVNTQWETQGVWTEPGWRLDLRYEYTDQDQLRSGHDKVEPAGVPDTHDEIRTLNRNLLLGVDYTIDPRWALSLQVPLVQRDHTHVHNDIEPELESWNIRALGDARVVGRYRLTQGEASSGVQLGLKLPTGKYDETNDAGEAAERSLQPGSGTTDALLGVYRHHRRGGSDTTFFAQALWQRPFAERDGYAPGQQVALDTGLRYALAHDTSAQVQLNLLWKDRDRGINAEPDDSGGRYVFLSPGLSCAINATLQVYGFVQLPLYQYVNGTQLTADWSALAGLSLRL
jgi:hypothetical protein